MFWYGMAWGMVWYGMILENPWDMPNNFCFHVQAPGPEDHHNERSSIIYGDNDRSSIRSSIIYDDK